MRIFYVISGFEGGGVEALLSKYIGALPADTDCHIVAQNVVAPACQAVFTRAGVTVHLIPGRKSPLAHRRALTALFREYRPDIVHVHTGERAAAALAAARRAGVPRRIHHSHTAKRYEKNPFFCLNLLRSRQTATDLVACGEAAARYAFGKHAARALVLKNGIDVLKYAFSPTVRAETRAALGLSKDATAVLMIARFAKQKNHQAALRIFAAYREKNENAVLLLVGCGRQMARVRRLAARLPAGSVQFLGNRADVAALLSAADRFILPSRFEGLPLTLLEALAAGLSPLVSDRVSREVPSVCNVTYLPVRDTKAWARALENALPQARESAWESLAQAGFSESAMLTGLLALYHLN